MNAGDRALLEGVVRGERRALAKAITLLESTRPEHRRRADALLNEALGHGRQAMRLGISGVPGVGKSTFIEALGLFLIERGHRPGETERLVLPTDLVERFRAGGPGWQIRIETALKEWLREHSDRL